MSLETGIYAVLSQAAPVAALVGTRIYPSEFPEGCKWPAILYRLPEESREPTMETSGVPKAKLSVGCFSENVADTTALAEDVLQALDGLCGIGDDVSILSASYTERAEGWDYELSTMGLYYSELTFEVFYRD